MTQADQVDMDQFEMDLADFFLAVLGHGRADDPTPPNGIHDVDEAEAILMDVAADLAKSQECRDFIGQHTVFWSCLARLRPVPASPSLHRLLLKTVRNACIHCPSSQQFALSTLRADQLALDLGSSGFASTPRDRTLIGLAIEAATNLSSGSASSHSSSKFGASTDPADLAKWNLNMLLAHPTKALRLAMVWLANGILPMYSVDPARLDRLSPGALVLERVFLMATPEKAGVEDRELAKAAGLAGFETGGDDNEQLKEDFTPYATAIVSALIRHEKLVLAYESSTNVVRADLLLHTHAVLSDDESSTLDATTMLDFFVTELGHLVDTITATSPSVSSAAAAPPSVNPVVLIELLHVLDLATLKLAYQPPSLLTHVGRLLAWLHTSQPRATAKNAAQPAADASTAAVFGTKKMALLLIAQLVAGNRTLQDQARDEGLVPLVLAQCTFDDYHPFIREYGIYCLRNLMLGNVANQALVEGMKVVDVAEETKEMLREGGLKGVDPERLRERLVERERERAREEVERNGWA